MNLDFIRDNFRFNARTSALIYNKDKSKIVDLINDFIKNNNKYIKIYNERNIGRWIQFRRKLRYGRSWFQWSVRKVACWKGII